MADVSLYESTYMTLADLENLCRIGPGYYLNGGTQERIPGAPNQLPLTFLYMLLSCLLELPISIAIINILE